jgi:rhodanese-related sulfurtransferase
MASFFKKLFGTPVDYSKLIQDGAQIIDVRTKQEFVGGHIRNSKNIPLNVLASDCNKLDKSKPVITCCASGMRSASAKSILKSKGFEVYNGGGWMSLQSKIKH